MKPHLLALTLAAAALAACQHYVPAANPLSLEGTVYNVRSFGATGNGKSIDSRAINRAIEAAAAHGGGTVFLPAGTYLSGTIRMKSNINLNLDSGARILGLPAESPEYDPPEPFTGTAYQDGGHTFFHNSLIFGENLRNIAITGLGWIDGGGLTSHDKDPNQGPIGKGDKAIALRNCSQVLIRDITMFHGGHFAIITTGCDLLTMDNLTIDTNRDGIDIDCCRNTTVSNCRINSPRDDALVPKASYGLGENRTTENLTITNCQVSGFLEGTLLDGTMKPSKAGTGRIKFGTEANGGFRNVTVSNCTFRNCRGLALEEVDGAILENFTISNLTMTDINSYAIYITTGNRNRGPNIATTSTLRNISISHVIATGVDPNSGIQITGMAEHPIENLRLEDIQIISKGGGTKEQADIVPLELTNQYPEPSRVGVMPAYGLYARHVKDLQLSNIQLSFAADDQRPAIACSDVNGLQFDNLKAQVAQGVTPARFEAVTDITLRNSPLFDAPNAINSSPTARPGKPVPPPGTRPGPTTVGNEPSTQPTTTPSQPPREDPDLRPNLPWLK